MGLTSPEVSAIYLEQIRRMLTSGLHEHLDFAKAVARITAHEVGHQFMLSVLNGQVMQHRGGPDNVVHNLMETGIADVENDFSEGAFSKGWLDVQDMATLRSRWHSPGK